MKRSLLIFFLLSIFFFANSCQQPDQSNLTKLKAELKNAQEELASLKSAEEFNLVHIVYLKLKKDLTAAEKALVISEIKKISAISEVHHLEVGDFEDLGDQRALSDYDIIFQMDLKDKAAYQTYQAHPTHIALKTALGKYLAGPPATYDFVKE